MYFPSVFSPFYKHIKALKSATLYLLDASEIEPQYDTEIALPKNWA